MYPNAKSRIYPGSKVMGSRCEDKISERWPVIKNSRFHVSTFSTFGEIKLAFPAAEHRWTAQNHAHAVCF